MAAGATRVINPNDYIFVWGAIKAEGFADDDAIVIDQEADDYNDHNGIGGEVTVVQQTDDRATITLRLAEGSPTNQALSAYRLLAKSGAAPKVMPVLVKGAGTTVMGGAKCFCLGPPKQRKLSATTQILEWRFRVASLVRNDGFVPEV